MILRSYLDKHYSITNGIHVKGINGFLYSCTQNYFWMALIWDFHMTSRARPMKEFMWCECKGLKSKAILVFGNLCCVSNHSFLAMSLILYHIQFPSHLLDIVPHSFIVISSIPCNMSHSLCAYECGPRNKSLYFRFLVNVCDPKYRDSSGHLKLS